MRVVTDCVAELRRAQPSDPGTAGGERQGTVLQGAEPLQSHRAADQILLEEAVTAEARPEGSPREFWRGAH